MSWCVMTPADLNPSLVPLDWLLGTWESDEPGEGCFPTIKPFHYTETLTFSHVGQPVINFTWVILGAINFKH
ncbi:THAP domain-containing protein 4 [Liparis tanakae]|uniref:THAP domain-containing protein 4 n=1 Tax=Liparis tanakae TaxID=230148 RepID=A0A4Z2FI44_9TELE|nr:THAP domain-containing protein 4 [Liparis tanakae]